ncbi:TetR/AcrR family transcriptional regulator [Paenibacillus pinihumi]|uniref:TetR/AcrR family transcriptional regulator n=1 Tax=Paenibacillus pinihumi TaxID=669462 RepID=UPI00040A07B4|nr:TetR/AcrR family transcriptional regulator [Paenibacillus pinihumi]
MARPREFDQEVALQKAAELFWEKGYERTSIANLVEQTNVHRGSLYDTFGDKNQLFLACLDWFRLNKYDSVFGILAAPGNPKEILKLFFERTIDWAMEDNNGQRGCFMANTAMDLGASDPNVASRIEAFNLDVEKSFYHLLERAQNEGQINSSLTLRELARFLAGTRLGLYAIAKTTTNRKALEDICKVALSFLD